MSKFDKIIGYETIKNELLQLCDMIHNKEIYERLGANLPQGVLLYGAPGLGKTLMAKCFIEESGIPSYTIRRNKGNDDFIGNITETFNAAKENAPSIVFLDDMDKFANEDDRHRDAEEYVAVQAGIDEIKNTNVFVFATANDIYKLPDSLIRSGRFDRRIEVFAPTADDASGIIKHYLKKRKVSDNVNMDDLAKMISYSSCAELETILNEAAIYAAHARKESIEMEDLIKAVLRMEYRSPDNYTKTSEEDIKRIAIHEAGHLVVCETLCPGSVGFASLRVTGRNGAGGFVHRCTDLPRIQCDILVSLGGKAAVEMYFAEAGADGCQSDIRRAFENIRDAISENGVRGFSMIDVANHRFPDTSENMNARNEAVVHAELERYMLKTRDILLKNREFLETTSAKLIEKETLLHSDIKAIRDSINLVEVTI